MIRIENAWIVLIGALFTAGCGSSATHAGHAGKDGAADAVSGDDASEASSDRDAADSPVDEPEVAPFMGCADAASVDASDASLVDAGCFEPQVGDPGFTTGTAWKPIRGATLSCGEAQLSAAAMCNVAGIAQTLPPTPTGCAGPLVMNVATSVIDNTHDISSVGVRIKDGWNFFELPNIPRTSTFCLGENAVEGPADLFVAAGNLPACPPGSNPETLALNQVSIAADVAGVCPPFGVVANGDFEDGSNGWTIPYTGETNVVSAEIKAGVGDGGSMGALLEGDGVVVGSASFPSSSALQNPALRLWVDGDVGSTASIQIGEWPAVGATIEGLIAGEGLGVTRTICVPRWMQGTVQRILLSWLSVPSAQSLAFDDLEIVSEPACATGNLFDPGFENAAISTPIVAAWKPYADNPATGSATIKTDEGHTGTAEASLTVSARCGDSSLFQEGVVVPAPVSASGPALAFWYRTSALVESTAQVESIALPKALVLSPSIGWKRATACLDPLLAGWPGTLSFKLFGPGGDCTSRFDEESLIVDDVELTTDPTCPTQ